VAGTGDLQGVNVAKRQPVKLAAMESHWETRSGAPYTVFAWPDAKNERNVFEFLKIPKGLSLMAYHRGGAEVKGLKDFSPDIRPPVLPVFLSFRIMVGLGLLMVLLAFLGWRRGRKDSITSHTLLLRTLIWAIPLPYIAIELGWIVTEIGRQPWIVYGLMKTSEGVSKAVSSGQVWFSLGGFTLLYGGLAVADLILLKKTAKKGPAAA
jgi:cytochrome d ubiquinol oxidase subunit I